MADPRAIAKVFGSNASAAFAAGEAAAQMTPASPFSPGTPIGPYDGYSRTPRSQDFVSGYNISARPRSHERIAFEALRGLIESYDVAQMCIWHRIDSIRSLDWSLVAASGYNGDIADAIRIGMAALKKPDRQQPFANWLSAYMYDILAFDAGTLSRLRNRRGDVVGLSVVDGTTIAPLLDYWGNVPQPPAEAYVQYIQGLPWNWLTQNDLIYQPFRKKPNSPYGWPALETILLNANTDLRFQAYFLQRFTEGNIPEAFAAAPESWSPDQIETFQSYWDSFMAGEQAAKHQIKWIPGGSTIAWSNEKEFTDAFSLHLMRKTAAAFHVVPADLGFTENVNLSSGESQADVQHRVGDLPLTRHLQGILSSFLQDDLGLPLDFLFDLGEEQADRLQQAQADQIYVQIGAISPSDVREMRYGLPEPEGRPVPRFVFTERSGPIPLASLYAVAGPVDPETAAPQPGSQLPHTAFSGVEGVLPNPPLPVEPLAEQEFGPSALPPAPTPQPAAVASGSVAKGEGGPTVGITAQTGITSYDLASHDEDENDRPQEVEQLAKAELVAFRTFRRARQRAGRWRDFEFRSMDPVRGRRLNQNGRLAVRKAAGEVSVAGLAVQAADTGRVLMLQRALDPEDPASGCWEVPGGHLEGEESPLQGAWREWAEEVHCIPPPGQQTGTWTSPNGVYQGVVWQVPSESCVPLTDRDQIGNPDDPDGDSIEAIAWWDPGQLAGNPAVRQELLDNLDAVLLALGACMDGDESVCPCGTPVIYDDANGWQHADGSISHDDGESVSDKMRTVAKAADPKGDAPDTGAASEWPGWDLDLRTVAYWTPLLTAALAVALSARDVAAEWLALAPASPASTKGQRLKDLAGQAGDWLRSRKVDAQIEAAIDDTVRGIRVDGYAIGSVAAHAAATAAGVGAQPGSVTAGMGAWTPGASEVARELVSGLGDEDGLADLLDQARSAARSVAASRLDNLARALAEGIEASADSDVLTQSVQDVLSDSSRAETVVATELARATNIAAVRTYQQYNVQRVRWATADDDRVCAICEANEAVGPHPLGEAFPSGDTQPPAHPRDRCALIPG